MVCGCRVVVVLCWRWTMAGQVSNLGRLAAGHQSVLASEPPLTSGLEHTKRGEAGTGIPRGAPERIRIRTRNCLKSATCEALLLSQILLT